MKKIYNQNVTKDFPNETRNQWGTEWREESMIDKVREIALKVLYEVDKNEAYSNIALDEALNKVRKSSQKITNKDIGFISELVYGTISWQLTLDEIIKKYSTIKLKKMSTWILNILRMSMYQIVFLDKVPKSAAVNEGVNLAKRYGHRASTSFVNAILRKVEKKDYEDMKKIKDDKERIAKTTSMPIWIVEKLLTQNTKQEVQKICEACNLRPKVYVRINQLKTDGQSLRQELTKDGIIVEEQQENKDFLWLQNAKQIERIKAFEEGKFTVQDEAAGLIARILNPKPGEKVLDACSSPGGKTTYMAEMMQNQGEIVAWDLHEHRIKLVEQTAKRLGISIIQTEVKDATKYQEVYQEKFDKILLDVPCLGLGVIKRKPDIKWKRKKEEIEEISKIQKEILQTCSGYLKVGGELVYSTCSILKEENEMVIEQFLKAHKNFKLEKNRQIYPNENTDGFFISKLKKLS